MKPLLNIFLGLLLIILPSSAQIIASPCYGNACCVSADHLASGPTTCTPEKSFPASCCAKVTVPMTMITPANDILLIASTAPHVDVSIGNPPSLFYRPPVPPPRPA